MSCVCWPPSATCTRSTSRSWTRSPDSPGRAPASSQLVEALTAGGVAAGLPHPLALALAVETVAGTGALLERTGEDPAVVRGRVSSPGGTTLAGLALMDARGVPDAITAAVVAAAARAQELGAASRHATA